MTLAAVIERTAVRYALTTAERLTLAEAVVRYVDDGPLAIVDENRALARKLGEPTMFRVAHRVVALRLEYSMPEQPEDVLRSDEVLVVDERTVAVRAAPAPTMKPLRGTIRCTICRAAGHNSRTCPDLGGRPRYPSSSRPAPGPR